jgi:hypothetical protein
MYQPPLNPGLAIKAKRPWDHKQSESIAAKGEEKPDKGPSEPERALVCVRCSHEITKDSQAIEVKGLHTHTQINPGGYVWNFRCFKQAWGCRMNGAPSSEFAWFQGYQWQIACCADCRLHLGWRFLSADQQVDLAADHKWQVDLAAGREFFGLISERLVDAPRS